MNNLEKIQEVFQKVFSVDTAKLNNDFTSETVENWDSVTQLNLVTAMEEAFDLMLDVDDVYELTSFAKSIEILKKYGVEV